MTNVSTNYFSTLSPLFDAALCISKRLYSAVQKMTSIIVDYNDSSIQPFHMLSSSLNDNVDDIQNFRSDSQWNETPVENISITEFCTHVTSWYYRAKKTQTQQDFWKENGLLHVICVPQWTLYKFIITVHPGDLSDLSAEVETITALLVYHNSLLADLSPSKKKFSFALSPEVTFHKGIFLKPVHTILLRTSIHI